MCINSDFKEIFFKLVANDRWQEVFVDIKILFPVDCLPLTHGYIHLLNSEKMCIKSEVEKIFWNFQQMTKVMRPFCWHKNFGPSGLSAPTRALYMCIYKIIVNFVQNASPLKKMAVVPSKRREIKFWLLKKIRQLCSKRIILEKDGRRAIEMSGK